MIASAASAVSQRIARLEAQLEAQLFVRTTRVVRPTPVAEQVATHARAALCAVFSTAATSASDKAEVSVPSGSEYYDETTKAWIKGPVSVEVTPGASLQVRTSASSTTPFSETTTG